MLTLIYVLGLWYFSLPLPPSTPPDTCYAEDGDIALSQKSIEDWTLLRAKCSCFIVVVKAYAEQKQPRLSAILSAEKPFPNNVSAIAVRINGRNIDATALPVAGVTTIELDGSINWITAIADAQTLQIGDYHFTSKFTHTAMQELQTCYASLKGQ